MAKPIDDAYIAHLVEAEIAHARATSMAEDYDHPDPDPLSRLIPWVMGLYAIFGVALTGTSVLVAIFW